MGGLSKIEDGGRVIAGLLGYNPGPGLYSRMSRAVEQMPKVIRTQELPGLLRKYPEGVPGWEVNAVAPALEAVESIPRQDLLEIIQQRSPAYTHKEVVLGGKPQQVFQPEYYVGETPSLAGDLIADFQRRPSPLGAGVSHGVARFRDYGQGGDNYSEVLLLQPNALGEQFDSHWHGQSGTPGVRAAVAHARFDTHGDALRINELQSDLGIHNRKMRESAAQHQRMMNGEAPLVIDDADPGTFREQPFPLEDAWADILIKRLALEAARGGHRAIEVASPASVFAKTGNPNDEAASLARMEHFYGKVVPGAIERLGRKMGGLTQEQIRLAPEPAPVPHYGESARRMEFRTTDAMNDAIAIAHGWVGRQRGQRSVGDPFEAMVDAMSLSNDYREQAAVMSHAQEVHNRMVRTAIDNGYPAEAAKTLVARAMPGVMRDAENVTAMRHARARLAALAREHTPPAAPPPAAGRRYIMSDEMRRRILQQGIGLGVLGPLLGEAGTSLEEN